MKANQTRLHQVVDIFNCSRSQYHYQWR